MRSWSRAFDLFRVRNASRERRLLFAFPGGAGAWPGMGSLLYRDHAAFRETVQAAAVEVERVLSWSPVPLFEQGLEQGFEKGSDSSTVPEVRRRNEIVHLGILHLAQADLWRAHGVQPHAVLGLSLGEITGPYAAGALTLAQSVRIIASVAHVVSRNRGDARMFIIDADRFEARQLARTAPVSIGHLGSMDPRMAVMLGHERDVDSIRTHLSARITREVPTNWQYHVPSLGYDREWLQEQLGDLVTVPPRCPIYSSGLGGPLPRNAQLNFEFYSWMMTHPFFYADAVAAALRHGLDTIVTLGPQPMNNAFIEATARSMGRSVHLIDSMVPPDERKAWRKACSAVRRLRFAPPAEDSGDVVLDPEEAPFAHYEELRRSGNVHALPEPHSWLLLGYDDVLRALNDASSFSSDSPRMRGLDPVILGSDPPAHDEARKVLSRFFSSDAVARRREEAERRATELLEPLRRGCELDVVSELAQPLLAAEAAAMLGVEISRMAVLVEKIAAAEGKLPALYAHMEEPVAALSDDATLFAELRREYGDEAAARSVMRLLWIASMTPQHSIVHAVLLLLRQPATRRQVTGDLTLLPAFVDEAFRLRPPAHRLPRLVTRDVEVSGQAIAAGDSVELCIAAANRDAVHFPDPHTLCLDRSPNAHLSFGGGIHRCIGASLAKTLVVAALRALLETAPQFRAAQPLFTVQTSRGLSLHGINQLVIAS